MSYAGSRQPRPVSAAQRAINNRWWRWEREQRRLNAVMAEMARGAYLDGGPDVLRAVIESTAWVEADAMAKAHLALEPDKFNA